MKHASVCVQRACMDAMEFGDSLRTEHVQSAFEVWSGYYCIDAQTDMDASLVRTALATLGFPF